VLRIERLIGPAVAWTLATTAVAAPAPPEAPSPPPALFLSPSGEPFRPTAAAPSPFDAWFDQADANHDGVIDRAEFRADAIRFFKRLDTDGDGVIDGFELNAYEANVVPELIAAYEGAITGEPQPKRGGRRGGKHGASGQRRIQRLLDEAEPVSGADYHLDGKVTLAEWVEAADARFDLLDVGKTAKLTREALKARMAGPAKRGR
jgi:hypothetical protein